MKHGYICTRWGTHLGFKYRSHELHRYVHARPFRGWYPFSGIGATLAASATARLTQVIFNTYSNLTTCGQQYSSGQEHVDTALL